MPKVFNKQQLLDLGLNCFAFELVQESFARTIERIGDIPEHQKKLEFYHKGVKITVEPCSDPEKDLNTGTFSQHELQVISFFLRRSEMREEDKYILTKVDELIPITK